MANLKTLLPSNSFRVEDGDRLAVAFSGGLDSTVLLHSMVAAYGHEHVMALHVHHGLQDISKDWVAHCARIAKDYDIEFDSRSIAWQEDVNTLNNIEARARAVRYDALVEMCQAHQIHHLLLAHHQDDQAETVLLQLFRGAGIQGLSAMPMQKEIANGNVSIWRPFLHITRAELEAYARFYQLEWIEDPSNQDDQFTRNFIRQKIMPLVEEIQPQFRSNLARSAQHFSRAQRLLDQLADSDLLGINEALGLKIKPLLVMRTKDTDRASNALRRWLALQGVLMPSDERLNAWWLDIERLKDLDDQRLTWAHDGKLLRLWRQHLTIVDSDMQGQWVFQEINNPLPGYGLSNADYEQALTDGLIQECARSGGEKIRIAPKTPRKILKNLFQEMAVPPWLRTAPLLMLGSEVLAVAGVGMNLDLCVEKGRRWVAHFEPIEKKSK
jgi:tRNA(Ile)-lysidine synthase